MWGVICIFTRSARINGVFKIIMLNVSLISSPMKYEHFRSLSDLAHVNHVKALLSGHVYNA